MRDPDEERAKGPVETVFHSGCDECDVHAFIFNNPWKLSTLNSEQKIFRFCVSCGTDRFTDDKWSKLHGSGANLPPYASVCTNTECWLKSGMIWDAVPRKLMMHPPCEGDTYTKLQITESIETRDSV